MGRADRRALRGSAGHILPEDREQADIAFFRWLADPEHEQYDVQYRISRPDGSLRWISERGCTLREDGGGLRLAGVAQDITALKGGERALALTVAALEEERDRLARIARSAPAAIHSVRIEADGRRRFVFGAERAAEMFGLSEHSLRVSSQIGELVHPDDVEAFEAAVAGAIRHMQPCRAEFRFLHPQRGERWIELSSTPQIDHDGCLIWHGGFSDVTERKLSERALFSSQAKLAAIFEELSEGLVIFSTDAPEASFNRAALAIHGLQRAADAPATPRAYELVFELCNDDGSALPAEQWPVARMLRGEAVRQAEHRLRHRREGWEKGVSFSGSVVRDAEGKSIATVLLLSDVTERRAHQAELERLNHELEERVTLRTAALRSAVDEMESFTYSVSHDLRAPLRALDGFSQALLQDHGPALPEVAREHLGIIRRSARRMGQLIDDLLAFSRVGRAPLHRRPVDPALLVRDARSQLAPMAEGRRIEWRIGALPPCRGDFALLRQVWINLISNALKYSRPRDPARIEIGSMRDASGRTLYFVRDNGAGFDMRYAHKLFGVFERLHRAEEFEGTGVGLAIVQRIVQRHGGAVEAEGEPGRGATFRFHLGGDDDEAESAGGLRESRAADPNADRHEADPEEHRDG